MALSKEEREQFLAEPHIAALSVSAGDTRGPLTVPVWYQYTPGGEPWVLTGAGSRKHRLIETQGEFTLMVQRIEPTVRYVTVDGPVSRIQPATDEHLVELTKRYLPPEKVEPYVEFARREHGDSVVIYLTPEHWLSADLGSF
jgi:nitroimidazol reductase NimA-like FMN-containing flavoprotein (pyridoxamine 5'-phosphate oxidase superfamily)